ncbi:MAG TPA: 50S ribosomal protein L18 [Candidatus Methylomirabilis sp.]|nr:50S ribosomal protein L18 [Candidatus Methylomirabilis sp.]
MASDSAKRDARERRHRRVRRMIRGTPQRPRLCVFKSARHIYAQIINDEDGRTLVAASTLSKELPKTAERLKKAEIAKAVGTLVAEKALASGIQAVVFDRGGYPFHGRVKALATAARDRGLQF